MVAPFIGKAELAISSNFLRSGPTIIGCCHWSQVPIVVFAFVVKQGITAHAQIEIVIVGIDCEVGWTSNIKFEVLSSVTGFQLNIGIDSFGDAEIISCFSTIPGVGIAIHMDNFEENTTRNVGEIGVEGVGSIIFGKFVAGILYNPGGPITFSIEITNEIIAVAWIYYNFFK